jgi:rubrerythrin
MNMAGAVIRPPANVEGTPTGLSKVEQLLRHFEEHEHRERNALEEYRATIEKIQNPMVKFVLNLIQLDEARHHELANQMLSTLEKNLFWRSPPGALEVFQGVGAEREELLALVRRFAGLEQDGIKEYENLLSESKGFYEGLFSALLRALIRDSEKHLMFLQFLEKYLKDARS